MIAIILSLARERVYCVNGDKVSQIHVCIVVMKQNTTIIVSVLSVCDFYQKKLLRILI